MSEPVTLYRGEVVGHERQFIRWSATTPLFAKFSVYRALPADEFAALTRERDTYRSVLKGAHGALMDAGDVPVPQLLSEPIAPAIERLTRDLASARTARDEMAAKVLAQVDAAITEATGLDNVARLQRERDEARTALAEAKGVLRDCRDSVERDTEKGACYESLTDEYRATLLARIDALAGEGA